MKDEMREFQDSIIQISDTQAHINRRIDNLREDLFVGSFMILVFHMSSHRRLLLWLHIKVEKVYGWRQRSQKEARSIYNII